MKPARPLRLEAEEVWSGPSTPGDDARHRGERAMELAAVNDAVVDDGDLMNDAAPFTQQHRAGTNLPRPLWRRPCRRGHAGRRRASRRGRAPAFFRRPPG